MRTVAATATAILLASGTALADEAPTTRLEQCQAVYQELVAMSGQGIRPQIEWWQSQEPICRGTGLYEYMLGKLYIRAKQYDSATTAFESGIHLNSVFQKELELALGDAELGQGRRGKALEVYRQLVQKYPDWSWGHHAVGLVLWMEGKPEEAIASLVRAVELNETAASFRILAMAYYSTGEYAKSIEAVNYAFSLDNAIAGDRDPMIAAIRSYTELGRYDMARNFLAMLLREQPSMREDEEFLKAGFYLSQKMREDVANEK